MKRRNHRLILILLVLTAAAIVGAAQDRTISHAELFAFMKRSDDATKISPYRKSITIETGEAPDGSWKPYSSMMEEIILPDRSRLTYKSGRQGEFLRIGKTIYAKENGHGPWERSPREAEGWLVTPSSTPVFKGPIVDLTFVGSNGSNENGVTEIRVVSKPKPGSPNLEKETLTYTYFFDEKGLLFKHESIAFNGTNWLRRTEIYEYDLSISIEVPVSQ
jgi:hypothetical protein